MADEEGKEAEHVAVEMNEYNKEEEIVDGKS